MKLHNNLNSLPVSLHDFSEGHRVQHTHDRARFCPRINHLDSLEQWKKIQSFQIRACIHDLRSRISLNILCFRAKTCCTWSKIAMECTINIGEKFHFFLAEEWLVKHGIILWVPIIVLRRKYLKMLINEIQYWKLYTCHVTYDTCFICIVTIVFNLLIIMGSLFTSKD